LTLPEVDDVTTQEEQLLNSLVSRVNQTQLQAKDPDAEALLNKALGGNPDALYIMAQTVLVQNIALEQAKAQVTQLQQQLQQAQQAAQQPAHASSFLGGLFGGHQQAQGQPQGGPPPLPPPLPPQAQPQPQASGYQPVAQPQYQQVVQPQYQVAAAPVAYAPQTQVVPMAVGQPSFLQGAMQTAAGVAAGALAFEGVEAVVHGLGGFGHPSYGWGGPGMGMGMGGMGMGGFGVGGGMGPGMMGTGMMGAGFERPVEETVVNNNYYEQLGGAQGFEHPEHQGFAPAETERHFDAPAGQYNDPGTHLTSDEGGATFSDASYQSGGQGFDSGAGAGVDQGGFDSGPTEGGATFDNPLQDSGGGFDPGSFDSGGGDSGGSGDVV
jgi:hypothetical protein